MTAKDDKENSDDEEFLSLDGLDDSEKSEPGGKAKVNADSDASDEGEDSDNESAFDHYQASTDEVDQYFAENNGEFLSSLKDLKKIKDDGVEIKSVELDKDLLKEEQVSRIQLFLVKFRVVFVPYFFAIEQLKWAMSSLGQIKEKVSVFVTQMKGEGRKKAIAQLKASATQFFDPILKVFRRVKKLSAKGKLSFVFAVAISITMVFFAEDIIQGRFLPDPERQKLMTFDAVAKSFFTLPVDFKTEPFDSAFRHPEYIVQLKQIVSGLKAPTQRKGNPMATLQLYLETSNQEAAVEIRDREPEFIDRIQRTLEGMTERELRTLRGKERMKGFIRRELNVLATRGRIKRVYIKELNLIH